MVPGLKNKHLGQCIRERGVVAVGASRQMKIEPPLSNHGVTIAKRHHVASDNGTTFVVTCSIIVTQSACWYDLTRIEHHALRCV